MYEPRLTQKYVLYMAHVATWKRVRSFTC